MLNTSRPPAVLFVPGPDPGASFVAADRAALQARVAVVEVVPRGGWRLAGFAAVLVSLLARHRPARAVLWFASATYGAATAAACRAAGVPWLVIAGGVDVAAMPEIAFGDSRGGWRRAGTRRVLDGAATVWAFSESARREILARARPRDLLVVPPAVDTAHYRPDPGRARERLVVSTCATITPISIVQKGLDRLLAAARLTPDVPVIVTGRLDRRARAVDAFVRSAPANVTFAGQVTRDALRDLYARAGVVAQLSRHEGFGVAAAEALAMGCAVVTTPLDAFAEVVGGPGHWPVAADASPAAVAAVLGAALAAPPQASRWAEVDRRYGGAVRAAAWDAWLAREGLIRPPS
jgi:glycosyltransferase involved in cell wall biosynthesis